MEPRQIILIEKTPSAASASPRLGFPTPPPPVYLTPSTEALYRGGSSGGSTEDLPPPPQIGFIDAVTKPQDPNHNRTTPDGGDIPPLAAPPQIGTCGHVV